MLRIGIISAATFGTPGTERQPGSSHGTGFASAINGWDESVAPEWPAVPKTSRQFHRTERRVEGARIVRVWDPQRRWAEVYARLFGIPTVCDTPEEACEDVDAVITIDDGSREQWRYAVHPVQRGLPVFTDKPLAMTARDARSLVELARSTGSRLMSASALRFVPDVVALPERVVEIGPVHVASAAGGVDLVYYGVHALTMVQAALGPGIRSATNIGRGDTNIVRFTPSADADIVLLLAERGRMFSGYQVNLYGEAGWITLTPDLTNLYSYLMEAFVGYARGGEEPYPVEWELEIIAALEAARRSKDEGGREVTLAEVLEA
jgi:predicted dehydrogenase